MMDLFNYFLSFFKLATTPFPVLAKKLSSLPYFHHDKADKIP